MDELVSVPARGQTVSTRPRKAIPRGLRDGSGRLSAVNHQRRRTLTIGTVQAPRDSIHRLEVGSLSARLGARRRER
jgi:hypothetical protein